MRIGRVSRAVVVASSVLLVLVICVVFIAAGVDAGRFHGPLKRFIVARAGRDIELAGPVHTRVLSLHPSISAEHVTVGNPAWVPAGTLAQIDKITVVFHLPGFGIDSLTMEGATLHLSRDSTGHANWQWTDPDKARGKGLPLIGRLSVPNAHVLLDDARRHLKFDGRVSAREVAVAPGPQSLRIEGSGELNGRTAGFDITGDPLATARRDAPYHFSFTERSSGSTLSGRGSILRPFDFAAVDTSFEASGADLKDLYFLIGVTLPNTGGYRLTGELSRRGRLSRFSTLALASGDSDLQGTLNIDSSSGRRQMTGEFHSQFLRLSDLGARAAGRDSEAGAGPPLLLSNAAVKPASLRRGDSMVNYTARRLQVGHVSLRGLAAKLSIDHGVMTVHPLSAEVLGGRLTGRVRLDARQDIPAAEVDLKVTDAQLGQLDRNDKDKDKDKDEPALEGPLSARVTVTGRGSSVHQIAATADGTVTAVLPHGTIRASLAELLGLDLRGLGLMLTQQKQSTGVRCGVASFQAHDGTLTAQSLVLDTDPVLILGEGSIHLDSEALDLLLHGHPKEVRLLRVRSPVEVRGSLAHPSFALRVKGTAGQAAAAVALGVVLTPLAAVLAFVDPGLAKDADCAALLAQAASR